MENEARKNVVSVFGRDDSLPLRTNKEIPFYSDWELESFRRENGNHRLKTELAVIAPKNPSLAIYKNLEWEIEAPKGNNNKKLLFTYDKSLERIKAAGKERHARPSEVFSFLIAGLENKLTPVQKAIADDMFGSYGEWLSMAWERKKDKIIFYSDPENLKWAGSKYVIDGKSLICSSEKEFPLARDVPDSAWIGLNKFDDGLVQFLYSRSFAQLPKEMREGGKMAQLYLPPENKLWPLGRGDFNYDVYGCGCNDRASRWVAVVRKNFP